MNADPIETSLEIPAAEPTLNELMARIPPYPRKDIKLNVRMQRAARVAWQNAADARAEKKEFGDDASA